jgi:hypothetical protein
MSTKIANKPLDQPQTSTGWRVFALGVSALLIVPLLGVLGSLLRLVLDPVSVNPEHPIQFAGGLVSVVVSLALSVSALVIGIRALKSGNRSWAVWAGVVLALLSGGLWVIIILANLFFS